MTESVPQRSSVWLGIESTKAAQRLEPYASASCYCYDVYLEPTSHSTRPYDAGLKYRTSPAPVAAKMNPKYSNGFGDVFGG